jgi:hypothetical protein
MAAVTVLSLTGCKDDDSGFEIVEETTYTVTGASEVEYEEDTDSSDMILEVYDNKGDELCSSEYIERLKSSEAGKDFDFSEYLDFLSVKDTAVGNKYLGIKFDVESANAAITYGVVGDWIINDVTYEDTSLLFKKKSDSNESYAIDKINKEYIQYDSSEDNEYTKSLKGMDVETKDTVIDMLAIDDENCEFEEDGVGTINGVQYIYEKYKEEFDGYYIVYLFYFNENKIMTEFQVVNILTGGSSGEVIDYIGRMELLTAKMASEYLDIPEDYNKVNEFSLSYDDDDDYEDYDDVDDEEDSEEEPEE